MEQDRTRKRALRAALIAIAATGALAGPAAAGGTPPDQAPAHGVRGETPPPHAGQPEQAPPAHAPAHGVRGTTPSNSAPAPKSGGRQQRKAAKPKRPAPKAAQPKSKANRPAPPAHAPAHGRRGTEPSKSKGGDRGPKAKENNGGGQPKVTLCHSTGSATNPYVEITVAEPAVQAHARHHDGADIIPAPAGGCPTAAEVASRQAAGAIAEALGGEVPAPAPAAGTAPSESPVTPAGGETGVLTSSEVDSAERNEKGKVRVLGEIQTEEGESAGATDEATPATPARVSADKRLPFTGADLALVAILGTVLLLVGLALWRATRTRPTA